MTLSPEQIKKAEEALNGLETFKTELVAKVGKFDFLDEAKFAKIEKSVSDSIEANQKLQASQKAAEDELTELKAAFQRVPASKGKEDSAAERKEKLTSHFNKFARLNDDENKRYFDTYVKGQVKDEVELKALSVGSDPNGGYLVQPEIGGIISTKLYESSPMRSLASVISIGTDSYEVIIDNDEAGSGWVGEASSRTTTNSPVLGKLMIPVHELYANPKATQKVLDDASIDMEAWLTGKVAAKFARDEATAFISGNGINKPRGIASYASGTDITQEQIEQVNTGSASAFTWDGFMDLQNALKEDYQRNACFLFRRTSNAAIMKLKDGAGHSIFNMYFDKNVGLQPTLMGSPAYFAADMPAVATNALAVAYGDFKAGYQIVDRMGLRILRDPYSDKPYVGFYTTKRVGGGVKNFEAIKLGKIST